MVDESASAPCNKIPKITVTVFFYDRGDRTIIDKGSPIPFTPINMDIKTIIAGIENCPLKPAVIGTAGVSKNLIPSFFPGYLLSGMPPELFRVID